MDGEGPDAPMDEIDSPAKEAIPMVGSIARGYARGVMGGRNPETQREKLMRIRRGLESHIKNIDDALAVLDKNPGVEEAIIALHRVGML